MYEYDNFKNEPVYSKFVPTVHCLDEKLGYVSFTRKNHNISIRHRKPTKVLYCSECQCVEVSIVGRGRRIHKNYISPFSLGHKWLKRNILFLRLFNFALVRSIRNVEVNREMSVLKQIFV
jgi:hypothetical protein